MNTHRRTKAIVVVLLGLALVTTGARADTWMYPQNRKVKSANGKYTALIIPKERGRNGAPDKPPRAHIYEGEPGEGGRWETLWAVTLSNDVAPVEVFLTDDAEHLITLDNWHNVGYGSDAVAFYERNEAAGMQLARYASEQFLTKDELRNAPRTVSSMWWRRDGVTFLDHSPTDRMTYLCVWLGFSGRWLAWDVQQGKPVDVEPEGELDKRFTAKARDWAVERLRANKGGMFDRPIGAVRLLARAQDRRDREALEAALTARDFRQESWDAGARQVAISIDSETRREADRALAKLDGKPVGPAEPGKPWEYVRLGTLEVEIHFDPPLQRIGQSRAFVYLVPADVAPQSWTDARPAAGTVLFPPDPPSQTRRSQTRPSRASTQPLPVSRGTGLRSARLQFRGVTPGRYRVKVVYDRAHPYHMSTWEHPITPRSGDYQSEKDDIVEVKAAQTASVGEVRCSEPVVQ